MHLGAKHSWHYVEHWPEVSMLKSNDPCGEPSQKFFRDVPASDAS